MISLKELIGNNHIKEIIKQHFFHAYIIEGTEGSGKHTLSELLSRAMVCGAEEKPCGHCKSCEKYLSGNHPDIMRIDGSSKITEMREYLSTVNLAPNDCDKKIYIINNADKLTPLVQNTLLKPLEEPLAHVLFILIATAKENLLETVRSRCVCLTMLPVVEEDILKFLKNKYPNLEDSILKEAVFLSGGYIGRAIENIEAEKNLIDDNCGEFYKAFEENNYSKMLDIISFKQRN
ncbi:MAG: polymerase delta prime subunit, partial [Clostridia bacterium]|nr:polymerase delta prime subunit [Clostridia bacterium]